MSIFSKKRVVVKVVATRESAHDRDYETSIETTDTADMKAAIDVAVAVLKYEPELAHYFNTRMTEDNNFGPSSPFRLTYDPPFVKKSPSDEQA